jgi:phosphoribosylamine--glycine ligase
MAGMATCLPVDLLNPAEVLELAVREQIDLTVVGPEAPLERGLADLFRREGRPIVGPSARGAALECSKIESKRFMASRGIPTARFVVCDTTEEALSAVSGQTFGFPVVVKADGLAAGKGVVVAGSRQEAEAAVRACMVDGQFGAAGARVVIEECLSGPEVSCFFLCDGHRASPLSTAQDHKRIFDGDRGPNTGGMGAFGPSPLVDRALAEFTERQVVDPVLQGMREAGEPYIGFLYVSLMLTPDGPKVIEFNVRFGDPEAQVVLPQLQGSLASALFAAAKGDLGRDLLRIGPDKFVGVVIASRGYPGSVEKGRPIDGLEAAAALPGALIFHSGTALDGSRVVTAGGRVLTVVGQGSDYRDAMATAYQAVELIRFDGMQYRRDIGLKAVAADGGVHV